MFNYRGYNESTGVPTPYRMKRDGETVLEYLVQHMKVTSIILHGESIGGMVAAHIACRSKYKHMVKMLICDKAFGSLDAVASRMLGSWASIGLRYIGHWYTNVVLNYFECSCPKVCLQDPNDEIINHTASLKVAFASLLVLGDRYYLKRKLSHQYVVSSYLNEEVPHSSEGSVCTEEDIGGDVELGQESGSGFSAAGRSKPTGVCVKMLREAADLNVPLSEQFLDHFCACVLSIGKHATGALRRRRMMQLQAVSVTSSSLHELGGSGGVRTAQKTAAGGRKLALSVDVKQDHNKPPPPPGPGGQYPVTPHASALRLRESSGSLASSDEEEGSCSPWSSVDPDSSRQHIDDMAVTLLEKVWMVLAKFDGGTGQLLGQACQFGADSVAGWVCCFIIYHNCVASSDPLLSSNRSSGDVVLDELKVLMISPEYSEQSMGTKHLCSFVYEGIKILLARQHDVAWTLGNSARGLHNKGILSKHRYNLCRAENLDGIYDKLARYVTHTAGSILSAVPGLAPREPPQSDDAEDLGDAVPLAAVGATAGLQSHSQSQSMDKLTGDVTPAVAVGRVIPVHCGHNGWLHEENLFELKRLMKEYAGLSINE